MKQQNEKEKTGGKLNKIVESVKFIRFKNNKRPMK